MIVTIDEVKLYLRIDHSEEDELLLTLINTAKELCKTITRRELDEADGAPDIIKTAILYGVTYLYENRENANFKELNITLRNLLFGLREDFF